jgi:hypothetical protein
MGDANNQTLQVENLNFVLLCHRDHWQLSFCGRISIVRHCINQQPLFDDDFILIGCC